MIIRSVVCSAFCAAVVVVLPLRAVAIPNPAAAQIAAAIGTWNCTFISPTVNETSRLVWSPFGDGWMHGTSSVTATGAKTAYTADVTFGYDPETKQWIQIYSDSHGVYNVLKSSDAPTASTLTFSDAYPIDPHDGPVVITLAPSSVTVDATFTMNGQALRAHSVCAKQ